MRSSIAVSFKRSALPASQPNLLRVRGAVWGRVLTSRLLGAAAPRFRGFQLLGVLFESGEDVSLSVSDRREVLDDDFDIADNVTIPEDDYDFTRWRLAFESSDKREFRTWARSPKALSFSVAISSAVGSWSRPRSRQSR